MIDEQRILNQSIKNNLKKYNNIGKIMIDQEDDYTGCLLNCTYFREKYEWVATDLSH